MADIIHLLPDHVANQIAAGEVIQRPASAVKEMLENSVDAGSDEISLILRDAGKTLIHVIDNGNGMSDTDARLCFERHATSKIRKVDDLYSLHTMGFRGEALASIAAVAQVELKTRLAQAEVGVRILIEGSECKVQEACASPKGTSLAIRNLFYNVPARRNFLKSNQVETRHILEEFTRVALANPGVRFTLHHNDIQLFDVRSGNFRQRIASIFGNQYNERLVPVEEDTSIVKLEGFIGKPEFARKNRGEQYFFVNNRFIKDNYLHHAVNAAYESLIPKDAYPSYWLNLQLDPSTIDVNIHPTKTEIKFVDDKSVYAILRAAVKRALGRFSISPSLDFDQERSFDLPLEKLQSAPIAPTVRINTEYNPFRPETMHLPKQEVPSVRAWPVTDSRAAVSWNELHRRLDERTSVSQEEIAVDELIHFLEEAPEELFNQTGAGVVTVARPDRVLLVDLKGALERIQFERYEAALDSKPMHTQQQLFPQRMQFSPLDAALLEELLPELRKLGFDLAPFGDNEYVVHGIPADLSSGQEKDVLQELFEQYRNNSDRLQISSREQLCRSLARSMVHKSMRQYSGKELRRILIDLFHCKNARYSMQGKLIVKEAGEPELLRWIQSGI